MEAARQLARAMADNNISLGVCIYIPISIYNVICFIHVYIHVRTIDAWEYATWSPPTAHTPSPPLPVSLACLLANTAPLCALVYGGGTVGLMGELARTLVSAIRP